MTIRNQEQNVTTAGLRRVLSCRVVTAAVAQLRQTDEPLERTAAEALMRGLAQTGSSKPSAAAPVRYVAGQRPLAVPIPLPAYDAVVDVAERLFDGDPRAAAGWLIARGAGIPMAPPVKAPATSAAPIPLPRRPRAAGPPRSSRRQPDSDDDGTGIAAPSGDELRAMREALGMSQLQVAAQSSLSRGTVAEVERGRRLNAATRRRIAETLAGLARPA